jgi:anti-sigma28 factor (negative regulator of flagellin synthesis)
MSSIHNVGGNNPVQKIYTKSVAKPAETQTSQPTQTSRGADRLELSGVGHLLKTLKAGGDIRADKVADIKAQIEAGTYENDQKLDVATDRLLDDLQK